MTPPAPQPKRSLFLVLGCAVGLFFLVLVAVGIVMFIMVRRPAGDRAATTPALTTLAPDWRATLRALKAVPPEAYRLALPRGDSGDAAALLYGRGGPGGGVAVLRLARGQALDHGDSLALRRAMADTTLDRTARAARMRAYRIVPALLADTTRADFVFRVRVPVLAPRVGMWAQLDGLMLRGWQRLRQRDRAAGVTDLRAALGLGLMMYEREPTTFGATRGLRAVAEAARLLEREAGRDTAQAGAAARVAAWAEACRVALRDVNWGLVRNFDSAMAAIVDTTLPFPLRAERLWYSSIESTRSRLGRIIAGPPDAVWRRVKAYERHYDPDFAALGLALDTALTRVDRLGTWRRMRYLTRGF